MLDTVRDYVLDGLAATRRARRRARRRTPSTSRSSPRRRAAGLRGPDWLAWRRRLEAENDNFWAALAYAQEAPDPAVAARLGTLGWYFALAERVSEGRRFLELAWPRRGDDAPRRAARRGARRPLLPRHRGARPRGRARGGRAGACRWPPARSLPGSGPGAPDARAGGCARPGDAERAAALAQDAFAAFEAAGDDWGVAATASSARSARRSPATSRRSPRWRRSSAATRSDRLRRVPRSGAAARGVGGRAAGRTARPRPRRTAAALELARRIGFADHAAFALAALGSTALARGDLRGGGGARSGRRSPRPRTPRAVGGGPRPRPARPGSRGGRGYGDGRPPVPRGPRLVAGAAAARPARIALPRARRQPGGGGRARPRRDRAAS